MPQECTAVAVIWPGSEEDATGEARYELWENFRPVWHWTGAPPPMALVSALDYPLATLIALHLARAGQLGRVAGLALPAVPRMPLELSSHQAYELYRILAGRPVSIVRYERSLISDRELTRLRGTGAHVDLLADLARAGEGR